jgi:DnaJ-class molecular chaperone
MRSVCNECHGTGQRRYFKGESRFVLSQDECPACAGLGFVEEQDTSTSKDDDPDGRSNDPTLDAP